MGFVAVTFLCALLPAVLVFYALPTRLQPPFLLACSYLFCLSYSVTAAVLLFLLSGAAWVAALRIAGAPSETAKRPWLAFGLVALVGALAAFKYLPPLVGALAPDRARPLLAVAAPIGLSYYVFKLVSYVLDVYWERTPAETRFGDLALYAAFFPQIPSGPIQRAEDFLPQIKQRLCFSPALVDSGLRLILFGAFEKLVVADRIGPIVDAVFERPSPTPTAALVVTWGFALQLYADFAGASDIAIGLGRVFGITSPQNFDAPFSAPNIQEFWRRWHMTLTSWMGDYVFTPLRMRLRDLGNVGLVIAIMANMMAVALWHSARWTFVLFGLVNGVYIAVSALTLRRRNRFAARRPMLARVRSVTAPLIVFHLMALAFLFVRARTATQALGVMRGAVVGGWQLLSHPLGFFGAANNFLLMSGVGRFAGMIALLGVLGMAAGNSLRRNPSLLLRLDRSPLPLRWSVYYALGFGILVLGQLVPRTFIYTAY